MSFAVYLKRSANSIQNNPEIGQNTTNILAYLDKFQDLPLEYAKLSNFKY